MVQPNKFHAINVQAERERRRPVKQAWTPRADPDLVALMMADSDLIQRMRAGETCAKTVR